MPTTLKRSDLIQLLTDKHKLEHSVADQAIKSILGQMAEALEKGNRIEIRGFGSFEIRQRKPRKARNPRTGETVHLAERRAVHFKPGKELKKCVNINDFISTQ